MVIQAPNQLAWILDDSSGPELDMLSPKSKVSRAGPSDARGVAECLIDYN